MNKTLVRIARIMSPGITAAAIRTGSLSGAEISDVNVGAQPDVVGEVPPDVIGIFVDHDRIAIPQPVVAEGELERRDAEVVAAEPETLAVSALEPEDMSAPESAREVPVFPRVIQVQPGVHSSHVVPDPSIVRVHMRCVRMTVAIAVARVRLGSWCARVAVDGGRSMSRHVAATHRMSIAAALRQHRNGDQCRQREETEQSFHVWTRRKRGTAFSGAPLGADRGRRSSSCGGNGVRAYSSATTLPLVEINSDESNRRGKAVFAFM